MLLVITNSKDATADHGCTYFRSAGIPFERVDTDVICGAGRVEFSDDECSLIGPWGKTHPLDVNAVWFRRPEPLSFPSVIADEREATIRAAEWQEALQGFFAQIPMPRWVNHPTNNAAASHKMEQLSRARTLGLRVPRSIVTQQKSSVLRFWTECNQRIIIKPLGLGYIEASDFRDGVIYTREVTPEDLEHLDLLSACPCLFQEQIEKRLDVRAIVIDEKVISVGMERKDEAGQQIVDIRQNEMRDVNYVDAALPQSVTSALVALSKSYGLRFAAIDLAIDQKGDAIFFEINPNGQWAWLDLLAEARIVNALGEAFRAS